MGRGTNTISNFKYLEDRMNENARYWVSCGDSFNDSSCFSDFDCDSQGVDSQNGLISSEWCSYWLEGVLLVSY